MIAYSAALTAKTNARDTKDKWSYTVILNDEVIYDGEDGLLDTSYFNTKKEAENDANDFINYLVKENKGNTDDYEVEYWQAQY